MSYTTPTVRTTGDLITSSIWNTDIVANIIAIVAGLVGVGFAQLDCLGTGTPPALSTAGHATAYFNSTLNALLVSLNGGAYGPAASGVQQVFRGLALRTHPDNVVAYSKVMLTHADEIVMDDGTRAPSWDALTADITASGAGGLDTGTEGASRWYEIYAIRKSSDGTKNLLFHRALDYLADQTQHVDNTRENLRQGATDRVKLAQGFQLATAGVIPFVDVLIQRQGSPTGSFWFTIEGDNAGSPNGTPVATSDKMNVALLQSGGTNQEVRAVFRVPFTGATATQYHLVLQGDYAASGANYMQWEGNTANAYANGSSKKFDGTTWTATASAADFWFTIFVTENNAAVTMPSGYDQKCKIGYVYNDAGSNFDRFTAKDRHVTVICDALNDNSPGTTTLITFQIQDMSVLIPPGPIMLYLGVGNSGNGNFTQVSGLPNFFGTTADRVEGLAQKPAVSSNAALASNELEPLLTEYQAVYWAVTANTGAFFVHGWEW
jgi:hypothetical protein